MAEDVDLGFLYTHLPNYYLDFNDLFLLILNCTSFQSLNRSEKTHYVSLIEKISLVIAMSNISC